MKMIEDWRKIALRRWSTWFASVNAALWTAVTAKTGELLGFLPFVDALPAQLRTPALVAVFLLSWALPVLVAVVKQSNLTEKQDG